MPIYLDPAQPNELQRMRATWRGRTQWPTWLLIAAVYGGWFGVAANARSLGNGLALPLLAVLSCWYMSLQHELLHGHPTRFAWLNALFGVAPLAVWFPYAVYRESHLRHHDDTHLTDPDLDPESYFVSAARWDNAAPPARLLLRARNTFIGRVAIGPWFSIASALCDAAAAFRRGDWRVAASWAFHLAALAVLAGWLQTRCGIHWAAFVFGVGYPALSLGTIRSFHEHRAAHDVAGRTVINEAAWPWRLLFLNNNFHAVHHALPGVPWFDLPAVYHRRRDAYLAHNGGFIVRGYREWLLRYAVTAVAPALHPLENPLEGAPEPTLEIHHDDAIETSQNAWNDRSARLAG